MVTVSIAVSPCTVRVDATQRAPHTSEGGGTHGRRARERFLGSVLERALHRLCRAYAPSVPLELLTRRLGWNGDERGCERFLRALGTVPARASGRPEAELDTRAALRTLGDRAAAARAAQLATVPTPEWEVGPAVPFDLLVGDW